MNLDALYVLQRTCGIVQRTVKIRVGISRHGRLLTAAAAAPEKSMAASPTAPEVECGRRETERREEREGGGVVIGILAGRPLRRPVAQNPVNGGHTRGRSVAANA